MKKIYMYVCLIFIFIIGIIGVIYGSNYELNQYKFLKESSSVNAKIYQSITTDKKQVLYINYSANGKVYDSIITLNTRKKTNKTTIKIYYDRNNPINFTIGEVKKEGYLFIILGVSFIVISFSLMVRMYLDGKRY